MLERTSESSFKAWNTANLFAKPQSLEGNPLSARPEVTWKNGFSFQSNETRCSKHRACL